MSPPDRPTDAQGWAEELRRNWERRAHSPYREFYIASHRGWNDEARFEEQARYDAEIVLHELDADWIERAHVLEIGCGSGRLARQLAPRVASYSGIDIAPTMVEVAAGRLVDTPSARVCMGSGTGIPEAFADRSYELIFSHAVLIHCPQPIIASYVSAAWPLVSSGGQLRLQLLADKHDPTGIAPLSEAPSLPVLAPVADEAGSQGQEQQEFDEIDEELKDTYYMGAAFRYDEVEPFLSELAPGARLRVMRFEPEMIYVDLHKA